MDKLHQINWSDRRRGRKILTEIRRRNYLFSDAEREAKMEEKQAVKLDVRVYQNNPEMWVSEKNEQ